MAAYFQVPHNREAIKKLERAGVNPQHEVQRGDADELPYQGLSFVVAGTLSSFSRREAEATIKGLGGSVTSSVTGKTSYLVAGESPGSKLATAQRLGTLILDEAAFLELLAQASAEPRP